MSAYYLNRTGSIPLQLQERRRISGQVRSAVDSFIDRTYGIEDFTALVRSSLPGPIQTVIAEGGSVGVLARQMPGICAEDMAMFILCKKLGLAPFAWSFVRDTFIGVNHDKRHRVRIPWIRWSQKGNMLVNYEEIAEGGIGAAERCRLDAIRLKSGGLLPEYHFGLRRQVFNGSYPDGDVSKFYGEILARVARNRPTQIYRPINGKDTLVPADYTAEEARSLAVRPNSHWYYPIYLSVFADGSLVLLDTYENPEGGVPEAKALFEKAMAALEEEYSWLPLVIQTAPLCLDMMFCNRSFLETEGAAEKLLERARLWHVTTFDAARHFADLAVTFRG